MSPLDSKAVISKSFGARDYTELDEHAQLITADRDVAY
jgi:hypothetical protein